MRKRNRIFIIAFIVQLIIVLVIVLFPEKLKIEKFTSYSSLIKPTAIVEYEKIPPNEIRKKIAESDLFTKYNGTRGIVTEDRDTALIIITNWKFEQLIHFDRLMLSGFNSGIGSLLIDLNDAPFFVPILQADGEYYTTEERQFLFVFELIEYLKDIGYKSFTFWTFGDYFDLVNQVLPEQESVKSLILISTKKFDENSHINQPTLLISGENSSGLNENYLYYSQLQEKNTVSDLYIMQDTYYQLTDSDGEVRKETEQDLFQQLFSWASAHF